MGSDIFKVLDALVSKGTTFSNLGVRNAALAAFRAACSIETGRPEIFSALVAANCTESLEAGCEYFSGDLAVNPDDTVVRLYLGILLTTVGRPDEALVHLKHALSLKPTAAAVHFLYARALQECGFAEEALNHFNQAISLADAPEQTPLPVQFSHGINDYHHARALLLLSLGRFDEGWEEHEWRIPTLNLPPQFYELPLWNGENLSGRTILLVAEQGYGDWIQFVRYAPMVGRMGAEVILCCRDDTLRLLFSRIDGIRRIIVPGEDMDRPDYWAPLMSLPRIFRTGLDTIPAQRSYLIPDTAKKEMWRGLLDRYTGFKVGIVRGGSPRHADNIKRSLPCDAAGPLLEITSVVFFTLQLGSEVAQFPNAGGRSPVDLTGQINDFDDTAALLVNLDAVVTVDTAVAHLSGALGIPTLLLLPFIAEWRWLSGRDDSPWYPSIKLFRQTERGNWHGAVTAAADELSRMTLNSAATAARLLDDAIAGLEEAKVHYARGGEGYAAGRYEEAEQEYAEVIRLCPGFEDAWLDRGLAMRELGRHSEAVKCFTEALRLNPDSLKFCIALGTELAHLDLSEEAYDCFAGGLSHHPADPGLHNNLGLVLLSLGRLDEAENAFRAAIRLSLEGESGIEYGEAHKNLSFLLLSRGRFSQGWQEYEWRRSVVEYPGVCGIPRWDGGDPSGRSFLLVTEQGCGDTIQFIRYAALLKEQGAAQVTVLNLHPSLTRLLEALPSIDEIILYGESLPALDLWVPLTSLPALFKTTAETIPAMRGYVKPCPNLTAVWKERLASTTGFKVGLVWGGNHSFGLDYKRSIPLPEFNALSGIPNVTFFSLQMGPQAGELATLPDDFRIIDMTHLITDFADSAAFIANLDLVITVDTAAAHLSGAMNIQVWTLLYHPVEWRWLLDRDDSPWYPSMRLFRQSLHEGWRGVVERVKDALIEFAGKLSTLDARIEILHKSGYAALDAGDFSRAERLFSEAESILPGIPDILCGAGQVFLNTGRPEDAIRLFRQALEKDPAYHQCCLGLGMAFHSLGLLKEARESYEQALSIKPDYIKAINNLGALAMEEGSPEEAVRHYEKGLSIDPAHADTRFNRSLALLTLGRFQEGWQEYEWRFRKSNPVLLLHDDIPRWQGESLAGRRILLHAEQGYGDTIQFIRYARLLAMQGAEVLVEAQDKVIAPLLERTDGVTLVLIRGDAVPQVECQASLLSLPLLMGTRDSLIPAVVPYLKPAPEKLAEMEALLSPRNGTVRVGIAWAGRSGYGRDRQRSIPLSLFENLLGCKGVSWFSLQFGERNEAHPALTDLTQHLHDFSDSAALVARLDLVICVDSAVAHLAGALGLPVWILLPFSSDWRWLTSQSYSTWYPSARLFRQHAPAAWSQVLEDVGASLRRTVCLLSSSPPGHNLARNLRNSGQWQEALETYQRLLTRNYEDEQALQNAGACLQCLGRHVESLAYIDEHLRKAPEKPEAHINRAFSLLTLGYLEEGWREYAWREHLMTLPAGATLLRRADLEAGVAGKTIMLFTEQGFGDTIQFIRYSAMLASHGATVMLTAPPELVRLLQTSPGITEVFPHGELLPRTDFIAPLLHLPGLFNTSLEIIPADVPYLFSTPELSARWENYFAGANGLKVGIVARGSRSHNLDATRSLSTDSLAPFAAVEGVCWVSLLMPEKGESLLPFSMLDPMPEVKDFADTAAIVAHLDLVISVDTAVAHLAAAIGTPVWLMLPAAPDWRWLLGRDDSPWYPGMRLFRQADDTGWAGVVARIVEELKQYRKKETKGI